MKNLIFILALFICTSTNAQLGICRVAPTANGLNAVGERTLVFILLKEESSRVEKLDKKDPNTTPSYKKGIETYNAAIKKYGTLMSKYAKSIEFKTIDEIKSIEETKLTNYSFAFPFAILGNESGFYEIMQNDMYKKKGIENFADLFKEIGDFSLILKDGKFEPKKKNYMQFMVYSYVMGKKKSSHETVLSLNFPFSKDELTSADVFYCIKSMEHVFELGKAGDLKQKASDNNSLLKDKTLYLCSNNLAEDFSAASFKSTYKGKSVVLNKKEFDEKLLNASSDDLFLIVIPFVYMPGVGNGNIVHSQIIIEGKSFNLIKYYTSSTYLGGTFGGGSVKGNYEFISPPRVEEYNSSF